MIWCYVYNPQVQYGLAVEIAGGAFSTPSTGTATGLWVSIYYAAAPEWDFNPVHTVHKTNMTST